MLMAIFVIILSFLFLVKKKKRMKKSGDVVAVKVMMFKLIQYFLFQAPGVFYGIPQNIFVYYITPHSDALFLSHRPLSSSTSIRRIFT
jgi:hypothetical protein